MNNAPFIVGQQVVALKTILPQLIKDRVYTVYNVQQCSKCKKWDVSFLKCYSAHSFKTCKCNNPLIVDGFYSADSTCFAPIEEPKEKIRYVAVSESLREKSVEIAAIETN